MRWLVLVFSLLAVTVHAQAPASANEQTGARRCIAVAEQEVDEAARAIERAAVFQHVWRAADALAQPTLVKDGKANRRVLRRIAKLARGRDERSVAVIAALEEFMAAADRGTRVCGVFAFLGSTPVDEMVSMTAARCVGVTMTKAEYLRRYGKIYPYEWEAPSPTWEVLQAKLKSALETADENARYEALRAVLRNLGVAFSEPGESFVPYAACMLGVHYLKTKDPVVDRVASTVRFDGGRANDFQTLRRYVGLGRGEIPPREFGLASLDADEVAKHLNDAMCERRRARQKEATGRGRPEPVVCE